MNLLLTSNIPNPIITPEELRDMVFALAELNPSLPDFVTKVLINENDFGENAFRIYAKHYRIPVINIKLEPEAVLEIGILDPENPSAFEIAAKTKGVPYLFLQIPELPVTGVRGWSENGEETVIKAEDFNDSATGNPVSGETEEIKQI